MHLVRRSLLILSIVACCATAHAQFSNVGSGWQVEDIGAGIKPSFDFGPNDEIHVMGMTEAFPGVVWHATADSVDGPWDPTVVSSGYFYGPGDLRVDPSGTVHLAYHDHDIEDAVHFAIGENSTQKSIQVTPGTHDGWDNSLAIDSSGDVRMASIFPSQFGAIASLVVGSYDGGADWDSDLLLASGGGMYGLNTSIDVDAGDQSHVLFNLAADWTGAGSVRYASELEDGAWSVETIESGNNVGRFPTLAIDEDDQLHAAWINLRVGNPQFADVRYGTLVDDAWQIETIAELDNIQMGFSGARKLVGLDIDSKGNPHLAIGDRNEVSYVTREGDGPWQESVVVETDGNVLNGLVVLRLDSEDNPGIAFWRPQAGAGQGIVSLALGSATSVELVGDFDGDGELTSNDIDLLSASFSTENPTFDLNADGGVGVGDHSLWVKDLAKVLPGDANFDGAVDFQDFLVLSENFNNGSGGWAEGNFDGQQGVGFPDFLVLSDNFGATAALTTSVPEPSASQMFWFALITGLFYLRRRVR